ncbi:Hypothetical predicted protein [Scomber scombrus]|uniref:Uncharacterized protein n=1 Tax=Scomber scombrus TaxID=13677 RepID=A0AAV1P1J2_SCOSC
MPFSGAALTTQICNSEQMSVEHLYRPLSNADRFRGSRTYKPGFNKNTQSDAQQVEAHSDSISVEIYDCLAPGVYAHSLSLQLAINLPLEAPLQGQGTGEGG